MVKNVGGKKVVLTNAKPSCIMLGEDERAAIAEKRGDMSISEYIGECIMLRSAKEEGTGQEEGKQSREDEECMTYIQ